MSQSYIPQLPESAPFTPEQRAYLNGFFAGLFSRVPAPGAGAPAEPTVSSPPMEPLTVLFGSQTGTSEKLAKLVAKEAGRHGFAATVHEMARYPLTQLASERYLVIVTSTYGDGEPPDNGKTFWDFLAGASAPVLKQTRFVVCALGDSNYPQFCAFGKHVDERLEKLGGTRVFPRVDCDVDYEDSFAKWVNAALPSLKPGENAEKSEKGAVVMDPGVAGGAGGVGGEGGARYDRKNPFPAALIANRRLNGEGSAKDTRHFEFMIEGSGLSYTAGDAMGVYPSNCRELVAELIQALGCSEEEPVAGNKGSDVSLREALTTHYEITRITPALLKVMAERTGNEELQKLSAPGVNGELTKFLRGREVIDLLLAHAAVKFSSAEFVTFLKKLQPRLYSIASSPAAHAGAIHLCVGVVRYESLGRFRKGVCSTFLAERVTAGASVPIFLHANNNFRPPSGGSTPMVMVGPGTGIAPFRGFLHERRATGATGRNWLFFGDQCASTDFLYRNEMNEYLRGGLLARLDTAFSRDQAEKIYVQNRMLENARELFAWLEEGAHFYVCGDASRMAKDVDAALHQVIQTAGGKTPEQAQAYVQQLKSEKRYQRDVY
jgi:sulfite reductase (NADPH) flavoprotein alpha-component